jgi:hypothetical protein
LAEIRGKSGETGDGFADACYAFFDIFQIQGE